MRETPSTRLPALRQLLHARFPAATHGRSPPLATGLPGLDELTGGLPRPALTELVAARPSCGTQLFLGQLLAVTRGGAQRVALVDAGDAFDPGSWPDTRLEHLVWVRARGAGEALAAADLLVRDANLALLVLDLRGLPAGQLRRIAATAWYRLQRAIESTTLAAVVFTPGPLVPSARLRLELRAEGGLGELEHERDGLAARLAPAVLRRRTGDLSAAG
jgi:hypothetical protein